MNTHIHTLNTHPGQWAAIFTVASREQLTVHKELD